MPDTLDATARAALPHTLPHWRLLPGDGGRVGDAIRRDFRFADFAEAWSFMSRVALLAEKHDHHPDWRNSWNRVEITLTTHDAGGLSARDLAMAQAIDAIG